MSAETVAIIGGTGPQGRGIGLRLAQAGVPVVLGSRVESRAVEAAAGLGEGLEVSGAANAAAAAGADVVFVAVPWEGHEATVRELASDLAGKLVVDVVVPLAFDASGPVGLTVAEGSAAEQAQALLPSASVVAGFHHLAAKHLLDASHPLDSDVLLCGDDAGAKDRVLGLTSVVPGLRGIDAGPLRLARFLEGVTPVLLSVNRAYRTSTGIRLTDLDPARRRRP